MTPIKRQLLALWGLVAALLCLLAITVHGQTNGAPFDPTNPNVLPQTAAQYWDLVIAMVSPSIIWVVATYVPKVPKPLLPMLTPAVGVVLGLALNKLAGTHFGWYDAAKAGALAVFVREVVNQSVVKLMTATPAQAAPTPAPAATTVPAAPPSNPPAK